MYKTTALLLVILVLMPGCAVFKEKNRRLTNALDDAFKIKSRAAKVALAPVFIPVGMASLSIDMLVLKPARELPKSLDKTYEALWEDPGSTYVTQVFLFLPKVIVTPVWFAGDWFLRSLFELW